jgi:hypothetical protein
VWIPPLKEHCLVIVVISMSVAAASPGAIGDNDFLMAESAPKYEDSPIMSPLSRNGYPIS